jgi:hypothetical protein
MKRRHFHLSPLNFSTAQHLNFRLHFGHAAFNFAAISLNFLHPFLLVMILSGPNPRVCNGGIAEKTHIVYK